MATPSRPSLITGAVGSTLRSMTLPGIAGMLASIAVNIMDAYWISKLGTAPMAAISFTFPIESLVFNIGLGLMIGTSTAVSRAVGAADMDRAARLTTHAMLLTIAFVSVLNSIGYLLHVPLFSALGADISVMPYITSYLQIWCFGVLFMMASVILNGALRAVGDAKIPMLMMLISAGINAVLDPLFILGAGPIPSLGLQGAALASFCARLVGLLYIGSMAWRKYNLFYMQRPTPAVLMDSLRTVLRVGVPAMITNALGPVATTIVTGMIATYGATSLAAYGIGARVDALLLMVPMALTGTLSPFIGQNWGAHLHKRVSEGIRSSLGFVLAWGTVGALLLMLAARPLSGLFTHDPAVADALVVYLRVIPIGYAFIACVSVASSVFNAIDHAMQSTWLSVLRSLLIALPAAWLGGQLWGLQGVYAGLVLASVVSAVLGIYWLRGLLSPTGEVRPQTGRPITLEAVGRAVHADFSHAVHEMLSVVSHLEDVKLFQVRGSLIGVYVGGRELAHLHQEGRIDLPLPVEIGDNLVQRGVVHHHAEHPDNGWYTHNLREHPSAEYGIWLLRLSHLLYEMSNRGEGDPVTQSELQQFTHTPACVAAMTAAANRWGLTVEKPV